MSVDVLAIGAHPDDVEVGIAGIVRKLVQRGHDVGILDLTQGEMGSRGSVEERRAEAEASRRILGVARRENVGLPDSALADTPEQRRAVIPFIRAFRPRLILCPMRNDRHPDHEAAHALAQSANHYAGLKKLTTDPPTDPWRAPRIYFYSVYRETEPPQLIVDITDQFEDKLAALRAFASQFHNPEYQGPDTHISTPAFWESIRNRAAYWGSRMDSPRNPAYGETLYSDGPIPVDAIPGLENTL